MTTGQPPDRHRDDAGDPPEIRAPIRPDAPDVRDQWYEPVVHPGGLPAAVRPDGYQRYVDVTWHQRGEECTGFALAAIANYTLRRAVDDPALPSVSRRMLYEVAQIHDGKDFREGSTLRGALKGWRLTGVARDDLWPYDPDDEDGAIHGGLDLARVLDARHRPLLGYRRIRCADLDAIKDALASGHALFAAATLHVGWYRLFMPEVDPVIRRRPADEDKGGHAVVIVGYDEEGLWVHNSWGPEWGVEGYAVLPYDDWLASGLDVWVVDLAPTGDISGTGDSSAVAPSPEEVAAYRDMWPHLVVLRDDGHLVSDGLFEMDEGSVKTLLFLFQERTADWARRRLAVIFDAGHHPAAATIGRYRTLRDEYMAAGIYPLFVVWQTSWWPDLVDELTRWTERLTGRPVGDSRLDPTDGLVGAVAHASVVRPMWNEVRRRARRAAAPGGGLATLASTIDIKREKTAFDLHLLAHGAGDDAQAALIPLLTTPVTTATSLAPVTAESVANKVYGAGLAEGTLGHLRLVTLDETAEASDSVGPVAGSLLHLLGVLTSGNLLDDPPFGLGRRVGDPWDHLAAAGRLRQDTVPSGRHTEVIWDADLHAGLVSAMLDHEAPDAPERPSPTSRPSSADVGQEPLPTDPLAFAAALRRRSRRPI